MRIGLLRWCLNLVQLRHLHDWALDLLIKGLLHQRLLVHCKSLVHRRAHGLLDQGLIWKRWSRCFVLDEVLAQPSNLSMRLKRLHKLVLDLLHKLLPLQLLSILVSTIRPRDECYWRSCRVDVEYRLGLCLLSRAVLGLLVVVLLAGLGGLLGES